MSVNMCNVGTGYLSQHSLSRSPYMFIGGIDDICQHKLCESEYEHNDDIGDLSQHRQSMSPYTFVDGMVIYVSIDYGCQKT